MRNKWLSFLLICCGCLPGMLMAQSGIVKANKDKSADDPTKITTKLGVAWSDSYDMNDSNVAFSGSLALDEARQITASINSDASEWRIGGSWLFPIGIINFNFGENDYPNGASQTNYSVGTFLPLSYFGFEPAGFQIFPMAGYTYNTGDTVVCNGSQHSPCAQPGFGGEPSPENGFNLQETAGSSGYIGAFSIKPLTEDLRFLNFFGASYGSKNDEGENYKGYFFGLGLGYTFDKHSSVSGFTYIQDNNTYLDEAEKRFQLSYKYQF